MQYKLNKMWYLRVKEVAKSNDTQKFKRLNQISSGHHSCKWCQVDKNWSDFVKCGKNSILRLLNFKEDSSELSYRAPICYMCLDRLYKSFKTDDNVESDYEAIFRLCTTFDFPYRDTIVNSVINNKEQYVLPLSDANGYNVPATVSKGLLYYVAIIESVTGESFTMGNNDKIRQSLKYATGESPSPDVVIDRLNLEHDKIIASKDAQYDRLLKDKDEVEVKNSELNQKLVEANTRISELNAQKSEKDAKKFESEDLKEDIVKLKEKIKDLEDKNGNLMRINHDYKTEADAKKRELNDLKKSIVKKITVGEGDNTKEKYVIQLLSETGRQQRSQILQVFHCDPFENDAIEDRESMYNDLITIMDDSMSDDLVRQKAAIEIVRAFKRIDKISETIRQLQLTPETMVDNEKSLKNLIDQKAKETALVTSFSKDHGFAEKYASSKAKGTGTLSAIVREMDESHYDRGAINAFDIETSTAIKQISDISMESVFKQLNFTDSEYAEMVKEQRDELMDLNAKYKKNQEVVRLLREKITKEELLVELEYDLRNKGIGDQDIRDIIGDEYFQNRYGKDK